MRYGFIIGSPKPKNSGSKRIAEALMERLGEGHDFYTYTIPRNGKVSIGELECLAKCDVLVFTFPVYIDAIPAHMALLLQNFEKYLAEQNIHDIMVYAFSICGFPSAECGKYCMKQLRIWTKKCELRWGQGGGTGWGEMVGGSPDTPIGTGPLTALGEALDILAQNMLERKTDSDIFKSPKLPLLLFRFGAFKLWLNRYKGNKLEMYKIFRQEKVEDRRK